MTNPRKAGCFLAAILIAFVPLALGQGTYTQIDVPGAIATLSVGINNAGDIVGSYEDTNNGFHGFLLSGGTYTTIDAPGALNTSATGINDFGQIIGATGYVGFVYDRQTGTFTPSVSQQELLHDASRYQQRRNYCWLHRPTQWVCRI